MSYTSVGCVNRFSNEQIAYMNSVLSSSKSFLLAFPTPDTSRVVTNITNLSPFAEETDVKYNVNFSWDKVSEADRYNILVSKSIFFISGINLVDEIITDTFYQTLLNPDDFYFWKVVPYKKGNTCAPITFGTRFFTGFESGIVNTSAQLKNEGSNNFKIYPNPVVVSNAEIVLKLNN